jgi:hypothetical protein
MWAYSINTHTPPFMPKKYEYYAPIHSTTPRFECILHKLKCEHIIESTGHQCKRFQIIGAGLCWKHLETDRHLRIKPSTIPGGGLGLFAYNGDPNNRDIVFRGPRRTKYGQTLGDFIIEYKGERLSTEAVDDRYGIKNTAPYAVKINNQIIEDSACLRSSGALANGASRSKANAELKGSIVRGIRLQATKTIRNGDEIFLYYGDSYGLKDEGVTYRHSTKNVWY